MYHSPTPISIDRAVELAPSIGATGEHLSRSERYEFVPTMDVLRGLLDEGFAIHGVDEAQVRDPGRAGYGKHLVRLRPADTPADATEVPEAILINAHDGSASYQLKCGIWRFLCANGMMLGDEWADFHIRHTGNDVVGQVIEGTFEVVKNFERAADQVKRFKTIDLSRDEQHAFCEAALPLRFDGDAPVSADQINHARRSGDHGSDLWITTNRVQENLVKGGLSGRKRGEDGRTKRRSTRAIKSIDGNVKLNQAIMVLAEKMADIKESG